MSAFQTATGCQSLSELTGVQLADYRARVMAAGQAPATQAQTLAAVRSFLSWTGAIQAHALPVEVVRTTLRTPSSVVKTRYEVLSEPEIVAIFGSVRDAKSRALMGIMLGAGLRVGEVSSLDIEDLVEDGDGIDVDLRSPRKRAERSRRAHPA